MSIIKRICKKIIKIMSRFYLTFKQLIRNDLPVFLSYHFNRRKMTQNLSEQGVEKAKPYRYKSWHFKYEYYLGQLKGKRVFIKIYLT